MNKQDVADYYKKHPSMVPKEYQDGYYYDEKCGHFHTTEGFDIRTVMSPALEVLMERSGVKIPDRLGKEFQTIRELQEQIASLSVEVKRLRTNQGSGAIDATTRNEWFTKNHDLEEEITRLKQQLVELKTNQTDTNSDAFGVDQRIEMLRNFAEKGN